MDFLSLLTGSFSQGARENPTVAMIEAAYRHHGIDADPAVMRRKVEAIFDLPA
jgi:hypothetical protein